MNRDQHHGEADLQVAGKGDGEAVAGADTGEDHVGGGADEGTVAAQAGTQGDRPPEGGDVHAAALHGEDERDEGRDKGDVIQERGDDGRHPQDEQDGHGHVALGQVHEIGRASCRERV